MSHLPIVIVVACARNRVIGTGQALPWSIPTDLRHFKALTLGKPIIMGRKTFASIGKPLPGRETVVVSHDTELVLPGVHMAHDIESAIAKARDLGLAMGAADISVAGGGAVYAQTLTLADRIHVTEVDLEPQGDTLFPIIDPAVWAERSRTRPPRSDRDEASVAFVDYDRRSGR